MTKSRRNPKRLTQKPRSLILCEGDTEQWYFSQVLDPRLVEVTKSKRTNVEYLVEVDAIRRMKAKEYEKVYCIFDRDKGSNLPRQLSSANKTIDNSDNKMIRVFSNPCIEVAFVFHFSAEQITFINAGDVENSLNKHLQKHLKKNYKKYDKAENRILELSTEIDFQVICRNSQQVYNGLNINKRNWLDIKDGYSEVFKLEQFHYVKSDK